MSAKQPVPPPHPRRDSSGNPPTSPPIPKAASVRLLGIRDYPGVFPSDTCRWYFETIINETPSLLGKLSLGTRARDGVEEYVSDATQNAFVGFALGLRCAERIEKTGRMLSDMTTTY